MPDARPAGPGQPPDPRGAGPGVDGPQLAGSGVGGPGGLPAIGPQPAILAWWRVAQFALDLGIVTALAFAASLLMTLVPKAPDGTYSNPLLTLAAAGLVLLVVTAINIWYWVLWPLAHRGQTIAMSWFGLQVVTATGGHATAAQLCLRMVGLAADAMFMGLVGLLAMLGTPTRQRLGDILASTVVTPVAGHSPRPDAPALGGELRSRHLSTHP